VRLGPNAVRLITDPLQIARALATLDEISGGRVDAVTCVSAPRYRSIHQSSAKFKPVPFVREMIEVLRLALSNKQFAYDGEYFQCSYTAYPTKTAALQNPFPLKYASSGGPRLLELGGEICDGVHIAPHYTPAVVEHFLRHVGIGAERAGKELSSLDLAVAPIWCCSEDGDEARRVATAHVAFYVAWQPKALWDVLLPEAGVPFSEVEAVTEAWHAGDTKKAAELISPELSAAMSVAGTPAECVELLQKRFVGGPIQHLVLMAVDETHSELVLGERSENSPIPSVADQLRIFHDEVLPEIGVPAGVA
jgi:5,10-methylenetetrahydromethanopterin reductase